MNFLNYKVLNPYRAHTMWGSPGTYQFNYSNIEKGWQLYGRLVKDNCFYNFVTSMATHVGVNPNDFEMDSKDLFKECVDFAKKKGKEHHSGYLLNSYDFTIMVGRYDDEQIINIIPLFGVEQKLYFNGYSMCGNIAKLREVSAALGIL